VCLWRLHVVSTKTRQISSTFSRGHFALQTSQLKTALFISLVKIISVCETCHLAFRWWTQALALWKSWIAAAVLTVHIVVLVKSRSGWALDLCPLIRKHLLIHSSITSFPAIYIVPVSMEDDITSALAVLLSVLPNSAVLNYHYAFHRHPHGCDEIIKAKKMSYWYHLSHHCLDSSVVVRIFPTNRSPKAATIVIRGTVRNLGQSPSSSSSHHN